MARPRKSAPAEQQEVIDTKDALTQALHKAETKHKEDVAIEDMPLESLRDYRLYNEAARAMNKKLRIARYPIKPCPVELHPKQRIIFSRNDQPSNPLQVYLSNHLIHFKETLIPGKSYDLPECIIHYLAEKGTPVWKWFDNADGSKETRMSHKEPRFSLRTVFNS